MILKNRQTKILTVWVRLRSRSHRLGGIDGVERVAEAVEEVVAILGCQAVGRLDAHDVALWPALAHQHAAVAHGLVKRCHEFRVVGERVAIGDELDAEHQTLPAHLGNYLEVVLQIAETIHQLSAARVDILPHALDLLEGREHGRAGERVAAVGVEVEEAVHGIGNAGPCRDRTHGETASDALGHHHDVRGLIPFLASKPRAGAAESGLNLVGDQEAAIGVDELDQLVVVPPRALDHAAVALDRLDPQSGEVGLGAAVGVLDHSLGALQAPDIEVVLVHPLGTPQGIWVGNEMDVVDVGRSVAPPPLEGEVGRGWGASVIGVLERDKTGLACRAHDDPSGQFVGF